LTRSHHNSDLLLQVLGQEADEHCPCTRYNDERISSMLLVVPRNVVNWYRPAERHLDPGHKWLCVDEGTVSVLKNWVMCFDANGISVTEMEEPNQDGPEDDSSANNWGRLVDAIG
jgi:hypothetical protein